MIEVNVGDEGFAVINMLDNEGNAIFKAKVVEVLDDSYLKIELLNDVTTEIDEDDEYRFQKVFIHEFHKTYVEAIAYYFTNVVDILDDISVHLEIESQSTEENQKSKSLLNDIQKLRENLSNQINELEK